MQGQHTFEARFRRFSAARRGLLNAGLAWRLATWAGLGGGAALLLLGGWLPGLFLNAALFLALALLLLALPAVYLVRRRRFRSCLEEAFFMEALGGQLNSRLISAWDFQQQELDSPLALAVIERAGRDLAAPFEDFLDRRQRNRRRRQSAAAWAACLLIGCLPWFSFGRLYRNACRTWLGVGDVLFPVTYVLEPAPGRHVFTLGTEVPLTFRLHRRVCDTVTVVVDEGTRTRRLDLPLDAAHTARTSLSSPVEAEYRATVQFGRRTTPDLHLVFTAAPAVVNMESELIYPAYTRLLPRSLEGVQPRLLALAGTRITLGFTFSKEIESAVFTWDDGETLPLDVVGRFASTTLLHTRQRRASLQVRDRYGFGLEFPLLVDFDVQADEPPRLFLPKHLRDDMPMLAADLPLFGFGLRAEDDFGVTRCLLKWQKSTVDNPGQVTDRGEVERLISPAQRKTVATFDKVFAGLALQPGDRLSFTVEVADNRTPERQVTRSRPASLFIYREELGGLLIRELGFGLDADARSGRVPKSRRATSVQEPEGRQLRETVRNEFEAAVATETRAPLVHGRYGQAAGDYFRLLSGVTLRTDDGATPPPGPGSAGTTPDPGAPPVPPGETNTAP